MEQSVLLAQNGEIGPDLLRRFGLRVELEPASGEVFRGTIANAEREAIQRVLTKHPRNLLGAAQELGISRTTLWRKMKKFGMIQRGRKASQFGEEPLANAGTTAAAELDDDDFDVNDFDVQEDAPPAEPAAGDQGDDDIDTESEKEAGM
ncbi:MAG: helix-turn-helix domain-containing protein [Planctomycetota bacterium]